MKLNARGARLSRRTILGGALASCAILPVRAAETTAGSAVAPHDDATLKQKLVSAYSQFLDKFDERGLVWRDGTVVAWENPKPDRTFEEKLADASLADQMSIPYVPGPKFGPPPLNSDPGRLRNIAFFEKMYGSSEQDVRKHLVGVPWRIGGSKASLPFTEVNGVAATMKKVVEELGDLPAEHRNYLAAPAGSFKWRAIAGTEGLSLHSFGIAVDINTQYSNYWRWNGAAWKNHIPFEIVDVFERHRFVWGGKWYHYDTMHFEYRPELIGA